MFTGMVEEIGHLHPLDGSRHRVNAKSILDDMRIGDSISVSGCCLTVVDIGDGGFLVDLTPETLDRTGFGERAAEGVDVNLERAVRLNQRLGGHLVQGHVDGVGEVVNSGPDLAVRVQRDLARYLVEKGSVTVDGCSLTVVSVQEESVFTVALVRHTEEVTTLGALEVGDSVNIEVDIIAKYVERLLNFGES